MDEYLDVLLSLAEYRHLNESGHDSENVRGCTNSACKSARQLIEHYKRLYTAAIKTNAWFEGERRGDPYTVLELADYIKAAIDKE